MFNVCWKLITASVSRALSNPNYIYLIHVGTKLRKGMGWHGRLTEKSVPTFTITLMSISAKKNGRGVS